MLIVFIPFRRDDFTSATKERFWNRCTPVFLYILTIILFLIFPLLNVIAYIVLLSTATGVQIGPVFSYLTFYAVLTITVTGVFFVSMLDTIATLKHENAKASIDFQAA